MNKRTPGRPATGKEPKRAVHVMLDAEIIAELEREMAARPGASFSSVVNETLRNALLKRKRTGNK